MARIGFIAMGLLKPHQAIPFLSVLLLALYFATKEKHTMVKIFTISYTFLPFYLLAMNDEANIVMFYPFTPILLTVLVLLTTRSFILSILTFFLHFFLLWYKFKALIIERLHDKAKIEENIHTLLLYGTDCASLVLLALLTQTYAGMEAASRLYKEKNEVMNLNAKYLLLNDELTKTLKGKDDFLLSISHELRNPLNILLGNLELAQSTCQDEATNNHLETAKGSGELLCFLINNLLDAGKMQSKSLEITATPTHIPKYIEKSWSILKMLIQRKNLVAELYVDKRMPSSLNLDPHRVLQILFNLISNASKFTVKGGVTVFISWVSQCNFNEELLGKKFATDFDDISAQCFPSPGDSMVITDLTSPPSNQRRVSYASPFVAKQSHYKSLGSLEIMNDFYRLDGNSKQLPEIFPRSKFVAGGQGFLRIEVHDTGCGIETDKLELLFKKFSQVSSDTTYQQLGTGLGLWITKNLCTSMGGDLKVYSEPHKGSTFVATFSSPQSSVPQPNSKTSGVPNRGSKKALVVEDLKNNAEIHQYYLNKCNYEVTDIATNGVEAVEIYKNRGNQYFDVIFMDIDMPIMPGNIACQLIREHERNMKWKRTMIVIITGHCNKEDHDAYLDPQGAYQADYLFIKPLSMQLCRDLLTSASTTTSSKPAFGKSYTILIVDDDKFNIRIIEEYLKKLDLDGIAAYNGEEAIKLFIAYHQNIDLILMDCQMDVMDGYTATNNILRMCKQKQWTAPPIIGLTGLAGINTQKLCLDVGMTSVIHKPLSFSLFQTTLEQYLPQ
jgi:signal transduction histidine kinase/CheY-like chemotaxis protein